MVCPLHVLKGQMTDASGVSHQCWVMFGQGLPPLCGLGGQGNIAT